MISLLATVTFMFSSCDNDDSSDTIKPLIELHEPEEGQALEIGNEHGVHFEMDLSDDVMLKSYKIEIHSNFDHHSHSTENEECELDPKKQPVKPWIYNKDYPIPAGQISFTANDVIEIPANIDTGDYHFMIRLTDKAGWQQIKSVEVKIK